MSGHSSPRADRPLHLAEVPSSGRLVDKSPGPMTPMVWGGVPLRNPQLVEREELLTKLEDLIAQLPFEPIPVVLHGMIGIGKTQLAIEYVYRCSHAYETVWWIDAETPETLLGGFTKFARALGLSTSLGPVDEVINEVYEHLRNHHTGRWLLIFDSANSSGELRSLLPTTGAGDVLVTSRNPHWTGLGLAFEVPLFTSAESKALLASHGLQFPEKEAENLAELTGNLPLGLSHVALWQKATGASVKEINRLFTTHASDLFLDTFSTEKKKSFLDSWRDGVEELKLHDPKAYLLLQLCAFLNPQSIPIALFTETDNRSSSDALLALKDNPATVSRCVQALYLRGLCTVDRPNDHFNVHPMVQWLVKSQLTPQSLTENKRKVHLLLNEFLPQDFGEGKDWLIFHNSLPHIYASGLAEDDSPQTETLVLQILKFLASQFDFNQGISFAQKITDSWTEKFGERDKRTLSARTSLGFALWVSGEYQLAAEVNARTSELSAHLFPSDLKTTLAIALNVAIDLRTKGEFLRSYEMDEDISRKAFELLPTEGPKIENVGNNLSVSARCAGNMQRALELSEETYQHRLRTLGPDNFTTLAVRAGRALDWQSMGLFTQACEEFKKIIEKLELHFGGFELEILYRKHQLAVAKRKSGDFLGALTTSREVMTALDGYTIRHAHNIECLSGYSLDLRYNNDLDAARQEGERALLTYQKILGKEHPFALGAQINLAATMRLQGTDLQAKQLSLDAMRLLPPLVGADHPYVIMCAINHVSILQCLGESANALELAEKTVTQAIRVLGPKHPITLIARANHVLDLRAAGNVEGERLYPQVLADHHEVLGNAHPYTVAVAEGARMTCDIDPVSL